MERRKDHSPPANWQDFEDLCLKLWRPRLVDAKKNGRAGQPQAGVDIFGRDPKTEAWVGIQCKQRGQWPKKVLTVGEIEAEVKQAESFEPPLSRFIIATTAPRNVEAQEFVREISDRRRAEGKFTVDVFAWDDLQDRLDEEPIAAPSTLPRSAVQITRMTHPLPLDQLSPEDFERLCLWLIRREGFEDVEHLGQVGGEQGQDLLARRAGRRFAFQCKRVRQFGPKAVEKEIAKIQALSADERPDEIVFIVTRPMSLRARKRAEKAWGDKDTVHYWTGTELDERAKRHAEILAEFFGIGLDPAPSFTDKKSEQLAKALETAYRWHEELMLTGTDPSPALGEILSIKRRLREGGQLQPGDYLCDGRFRLLQQVGRGGFARVFKAHDRQDLRLVAVKVLHGQYAQDRNRRDRFFRGARKMAQLHHQGIARVVERYLEEAGYHFFVMEYVEGGDLNEAVLARHLDAKAGMAIIHEVAEALAYAHERSVFHRDIKPANILLTAEGRAKLTDFDLVRAEDTTGGTGAGSMLGTFPFTAPEAMENSKTAGISAEVYALGMTLAFVLHGQKLSSSVWSNRDEFLEGLSCSESLRRLVARAISLKAEERHASMEDLAEALADLGGEHEVTIETHKRHIKSSGKNETPSISWPLEKSRRRRHLEQRAFDRCFHLDDTTVPAVRLVGASNEFFPVETLTVLADSNKYSIPEPLLSKREALVESLEKEAYDRGRAIFNGPSVRMMDFRIRYPDVMTERKHLEVVLSPLDYYDYAIMRRVSDAAMGDDNEDNISTYLNVSEILDTGSIRSSKLSNAVGTATSLVTRDGVLLFARRSKQVSDLGGWHTSAVAENLQAEKDEVFASDPSARSGALYRAVVRGIEEELSPAIASIARHALLEPLMLGISFDLEGFHPDFLFLWITEFRADEILSLIRSQPGVDFFEGRVRTIDVSTSMDGAARALASELWTPGGAASVVRGLEFLRAVGESLGTMEVVSTIAHLLDKGARSLECMP